MIWTVVQYNDMIKHRTVVQYNDMIKHSIQ